MKILTRWTIIMVTAMVGCYFAGLAGAFSGLLKYDKSYLGITIILISLASSIYMGFISKEIDIWNKRITKHHSSDELEKQSFFKKIGIVRYAAEACFDLGLLSTIIGLVLMFLGMGQDTVSLINAIKNGLSTAFIPTLVGMVANLILRFQMFIAEHYIKD
jgi:ABC-type uncharacterized transport system permease subunit